MIFMENCSTNIREESTKTSCSMIFPSGRSRIHDLIRRCTKTLEGYEEKLHLVAKFQAARQKVAQIDALVKEFRSTHNEAIMEEIEQISNQILEEL